MTALVTSVNVLANYCGILSMLLNVFGPIFTKPKPSENEKFSLSNVAAFCLRYSPRANEKAHCYINARRISRDLPLIETDEFELPITTSVSSINPQQAPQTPTADQVFYP